MKREGNCLRRFIYAAMVAFALPAVALAQLNVITSGGFFFAYQELVPEFEKSTGILVTTLRGPSQGTGPNTIGAQLRRGVAADVVIMSRAGLNELIADGRIVAGTDVDLARTSLGLAIRAGASKPDIGSVDALKQTLLRATSVAYESSTIPYMRERLLPQLGIANAVIPKSIKDGAPAVASGAADVVIAPVSELLHAPGVDYVGAIPSEVQSPETFSAAIVAESKEREAAKGLIRFLTSEHARTAIRDSGMQPSN
jgi:molybdate transport system substrate-binding protein